MTAEWVLGSGTGSKTDPLGTAYHTPNALIAPREYNQFINVCETLSLTKYTKIFSTKGRGWAKSGHGMTLYNHDINIDGRSCLNGTKVFEGAWTASSRHHLAVNVLFVDGHVRSVRNSIPLAMWRALGTRAGGEAVGEGAF